MDDIPVMSRAACRNHAVRTLGYVNHTAWLTRGKGNYRGSTGNGGVASRAEGGGMSRQRGCESVVKLEIMARSTRLSRIDCPDRHRSRII